MLAAVEEYELVKLLGYDTLHEQPPTGAWLWRFRTIHFASLSVQAEQANGMHQQMADANKGGGGGTTTSTTTTRRRQG